MINNFFPNSSGNMSDTCLGVGQENFRQCNVDCRQARDVNAPPNYPVNEGLELNKPSTDPSLGLNENQVQVQVH